MAAHLQALLRQAKSRVQVDLTVTAACHLWPSIEEALAMHRTRRCSGDAGGVHRIFPTFRGYAGRSAVGV